jgi:DNA-nicking Smr family endonuclease
MTPNPNNNIINNNNSNNNNILEGNTPNPYSDIPSKNQHDDITFFFQELFPKLDKELLDMIIKENDYDVFKALDVFIKIDDSEKEEENVQEEVQETFENVIDNLDKNEAQKQHQKEEEIVYEEENLSEGVVDDTSLALSILVDMFPEVKIKNLEKALIRNENNVEESINDILERNSKNPSQPTPKQLKERKERKESRNSQPNNNKQPTEVKKLHPFPKKIQQTPKEAPSLPLPMTKTHIYELYGINKEKDLFMPTNFSSSKVPKRHLYVPQEEGIKVIKVEQPEVRELPRKNVNNFSYSPPQQWTLAKKLQFQSLVNHFPDMDHAVLETVFIYCEFHVETTKSKLEEIMVKDSKRFDFEEIPQENIPKATYRRNSSDLIKDEQKNNHNEPNKMKLRNECFHQAARAFVDNDNAKAKIFSDLGRRMNRDIINEKQFELRQKLVNNVETTFSKDFPQVPKIDLHGFYVKNALEILEKLLIYYEGKCPNGVNVITGVGNHSIGPARIKPAVYNYLVENGFRFKPNNPGSYLVFP